MSKLEALQEFASRAKMAGLSLHATNSSGALPSSAQQDGHPQADKVPVQNGRQQWPGFVQKPSHASRPAQRLIVMDDLPQAHDVSARTALLETICESASMPSCIASADA